MTTPLTQAAQQAAEKLMPNIICPGRTEDILKVVTNIITAAFAPRFAELEKERDGWEADAKRYCTNADYWREEWNKQTANYDQLRSDLAAAIKERDATMAANKIAVDLQVKHLHDLAAERQWCERMRSALEKAHSHLAILWTAPIYTEGRDDGRGQILAAKQTLEKALTPTTNEGREAEWPDVIGVGPQPMEEREERAIDALIALALHSRSAELTEKVHAKMDELAARNLPPEPVAEPKPETPETDAWEKDFKYLTTYTDHAKALERDRNALRTQLAAVTRERDEAIHELNIVWMPAAAMNEKYARGFEAERDTALAKLDEWRGQVQKALTNADVAEEQRDTAQARVKELERELEIEGNIAGGTSNSLGSCLITRQKLQGELNTALSRIAALEAERDALRLAFAEASHNAGPAFVAHEELNRLKAENESLTAQLAQRGEDGELLDVTTAMTTPQTPDLSVIAQMAAKPLFQAIVRNDFLTEGAIQEVILSALIEATATKP